MILNIRNMVCRHCVNALADILRDAGLHARHVEIGTAEIEEDSLGEATAAKLDSMLAAAGFERITDTDTILIDRVKRTIIDHIHEQPDCDRTLSACIEAHIGMPYDTVSRIFSQNEGRTIERFFITQKIERVKELIAYNELTLNEIAYKTGYSSTAHLSRQFKQITGMSPSEYRIDSHPRKPINEV